MRNLGSKRVTTSLIVLALATAGCSAGAEEGGSDSDLMPEVDGPSVVAQVWADNWFEMYVNGEKVLEDSVPITAEKSFNAEAAALPREYPMVVAFMAKDFKENDTGLEYIGTNRQQTGDGGFIAQFRDTQTDSIVGVTNSAMKCMVVHRAPVERSCADEENPVAGEGACAFEETEIPADWTAVDFDDSAWPAATEHSESDVSPKDGYDKIDWDPSAQLVWSDDLVRDNTLLCRMTITGE